MPPRAAAPDAFWRRGANDCPADRAHVAGADLRRREDHRAPAHELAEAATGVFIRHRRNPSLTPDSRREDVRIGFCGCGTKRCWGEAMFEYCEGPLDDARLAALQDAHCVRAPEGAANPGAAIRTALNWNKVYAWHLAAAAPYEEPLPFKHKKGAQTWVDLHAAVAA